MPVRNKRTMARRAISRLSVAVLPKIVVEVERFGKLLAQTQIQYVESPPFEVLRNL
jgi:hypothetical protein